VRQGHTQNPASGIHDVGDEGVRETLGEAVLQAFEGGAVVELAGDLVADAAQDVGVHVGEQEPDRFQHGVETLTERQWRALVRALPGRRTAGGGGGVLRAKREIPGCGSSGTKRLDGRGIFRLHHRHFAYGG
jgi:hypothetical protein